MGIAAFARAALAAAAVAMWAAPATLASDGVTCSPSGSCRLVLADPSRFADWTVPSGVATVDLVLIGAAGGSSGDSAPVGPVAHVRARVRVARGDVIRLAPGAGGRDAADGGAGGRNPAGGFAGGAGGRAVDIQGSAGGGGAASVAYLRDIVVVARGGDGASTATATGGGGGGASQSPSVEGVETFRAVEPNTDGRITLAFQRIDPSPAVTFADPTRPLDNPSAVAQLTVAVVALMTALGGSLLRSDDSDHVEKFESLDTDATHIGDVEHGPGDRWRVWAFAPLSFGRGFLRSAIFWWASRSPATSRLLIDGAYLRSMVGSLAVLVPLAALGIAVRAGVQAGTRTDLAISVVAALLCLGAADALAGALGFGALAVALALRFGVGSAHAVEYLVALTGLGVVPPLAAAAFRPARVRHGDGIDGLWERCADVVVAPLVTTLVSVGMISALPVMARDSMAVAGSALRLAAMMGAVFSLRVLAEAAAVRWFPRRLAHDHDEHLPTPSHRHAHRTAAVRVLVLLAVGYTFIGSCWQLYCGTAVFAAGQVLGLVKSRLPNYPHLWQALPGGLPGMAATMLLGAAVAAQAHRLLGETPHMARTTFALCGIPMLGWSLLKALGRSPAQGQVRWYRTPERRVVYRTGGPIVVWLVLRLNHFV